MADETPFTPVADSGTPAASAQTLATRRKIAEGLLRGAADVSPVGHWTQALGRITQGLVGGWLGGSAEAEDRARDQRAMDMVNALIGGGPQTPPGTAGAPTTTPPPSTTGGPPTTAPAPGGGPPSIRHLNPGGMYPGASATQFGSTGSARIGGGHLIATFPDAESGAAAQFHLLGSPGYVNTPLSAIIRRWSGGNNWQGYLADVSQRAGIAPDTVIGADFLQSPRGIALAQAMARWEAGQDFPLDAAGWTRAQARAFGLQAPPGGGTGFTPTGYTAGPGTSGLPDALTVGPGLAALRAGAGQPVPAPGAGTMPQTPPVPGGGAGSLQPPPGAGGPQPVSGTLQTGAGGLQLSPQARQAIAAMTAINPAAATQMVLQMMVRADQPTDAQRDYAAYVADQTRRGLPVQSFSAWDLERRRATATAFTSVQQGENRQSQLEGEHRATFTRDIRTGGDQAYTVLGRIAIARQALDTPGAYTGPLAANFVLPLRQLIASLGGSQENQAAVTSLESFRAQVNQLVLGNLGGSLGAQVSDADRNFITQTVAGLGNTPEGNRRILEIMEGLARRQIAVAGLLDEYAAAHGGQIDAGFYSHLRRWREANPLFGEQASPGTTPPAPGGGPPGGGGDDPLGLRR